MADQVDVSGGSPGSAGQTAGGESGSQFGLTAAMALIVGSIIGVGIFNLPTSLAFYGPITLVSMALTTVGALALALLFASLSRRLPADGGPYAYARAAFGNPLGFANAWSYWITAWAGNAAIAVGWVLYVEHFINTGHTKWITVLLVLAGLWIPAASICSHSPWCSASCRARSSSTQPRRSPTRSTRCSVAPGPAT